MEMVELIRDYGIGIACIAYFMIRDYKFMDTLQKTLTSLNESTELIKKYFLQKGDKEDDLR